MLLLSKLLMLAVTSCGHVSDCVCIFNFETVSSLYRALYEARLCIPNILDGIKLHQAPQLEAPQQKHRKICPPSFIIGKFGSGLIEQIRFYFENGKK